MSREVNWRLVGAVAVAGALVGGAYIYRSRWLKQQTEQLLAEYRHQMTLSVTTLNLLRDAMLAEFRKGLAKQGSSSILMIPAMVDIFPDGSEEGEYFAIDIGGTNFRVLYVKLGIEKSKVDDLKMEECSIPEHCFDCHATKLFDFMAGELIKFVKKIRKSQGTQMPPVVGFCFSFPCEHSAIAVGKLIKWTKRFCNPGGLGEDPVALLKDAFARQGFAVRIEVMLNDTVGTLAAALYGEPDTQIGIILGTGTNAAYIEKVEFRSIMRELGLPVPNGKNIKTLPKGHKGNSDRMVINTEWANFNSPLLPTLAEDAALNADSVHPGGNLYEKMMSGMYMGEIARRILVRLASQGRLFGDTVPELLTNEWALDTPHMSKIEGDSSPDLAKARAIVAEVFGVEDCPLGALRQVQEMCRLVAMRGARLGAAGVAALLRQIGRDGSAGPVTNRTVISIDGGLFRNYKRYREAVSEALEEMLGPEVAGKVSIIIVEDGSSQGAAYLAAAAAKAAKQRKSDSSGGKANDGGKAKDGGKATG